MHRSPDAGDPSPLDAVADPDRADALDRGRRPAPRLDLDPTRSPPARELVPRRRARALDPEPTIAIAARRRRRAGAAASTSARSTRRLYDPIYKHWFRVEWEGFEHLPDEGGALLVANHAGAIPSDAPVIMHGIETELGRPVYGLAENLFRSLPVVGTLWSRSGGVAAHPDNAYRLLHDEQQLVLVFPEGTKATGKRFNERYQLRRFGRGGFVEIAMRAGVPVIPIAVVGAEESMPIVFKSRRARRSCSNIPYFPITANMLAVRARSGSSRYFPAKFRIRVLPPVHFDVAARTRSATRAAA